MGKYLPLNKYQLWADMLKGNLNQPIRDKHFLEFAQNVRTGLERPRPRRDLARRINRVLVEQDSSSSEEQIEELHDVLMENKALLEELLKELEGAHKPQLEPLDHFAGKLSWWEMFTQCTRRIMQAVHLDVFQRWIICPLLAPQQTTAPEDNNCRPLEEDSRSLEFSLDSSMVNADMPPNSQLLRKYSEFLQQLQEYDRSNMMLPSRPISHASVLRRMAMAQSPHPGYSREMDPKSSSSGPTFPSDSDSIEFDFADLDIYHEFLNPSIIHNRMALENGLRVNPFVVNNNGPMPHFRRALRRKSRRSVPLSASRRKAKFSKSQTAQKTFPKSQNKASKSRIPKASSGKASSEEYLQDNPSLSEEELQDNPSLSEEELQDNPSLSKELQASLSEEELQDNPSLSEEANPSNFFLKNPNPRNFSSNPRNSFSPKSSSHFQNDF